ncbi:hypothetical protein QUF50_04240, partial [Thiotrichales bacterium HSG1]|nr:hypothetical protein [Thiotrichales bacterium HSG1]
EPGTPFGSSVEAIATYQRYAHSISYNRLSSMFKEIYHLDISEGGLANLNAYLVGFEPGGGWNYFPSVPELLVTLGIFSMEIMLYLIFVKRLPVLHRVEA